MDVVEAKGLHSLKPSPGATKERKRVGRGPGSGTGKTSGRGQKGQKSRSGSHMMRAGFEGGQMPLYMRVGKLRGSTKKMSMPMGPFRTKTYPVNIDQFNDFPAGTEVTPEVMRDNGWVRNLKHPIKVLGRGELSVALKVSADRFSASAKAAIEKAGGTVTVLAVDVEPVRKMASKKDRAAGTAVTVPTKKVLAAKKAAAAEATAE